MAKKRVGRPSGYRKDFHPFDYIELSKQGKCKVEIAAAWDIDEATLYRWKDQFTEFCEAIKKGETHLANWYISVGKEAMDRDPKTFNSTVYIWMTKNILKWTDKVEKKIEHSGEVKSNFNKEQALKDLFKTERSAALALELAEELCEKKEEKKEHGED